MSRFISEIFILFHGVYFCFCVNTYNLKSRKLIPPVIIFFLKTALAIRDLLCFHMNCEKFCFSSTKNAIGNLIGIALYLSEKAMAPHSSTLAWKIPLTEEPGGLQSMGSLRVRHD